MKIPCSHFVRTAFASLLFFASAPSNSADVDLENAMFNGAVYVHTARNSPKFSRGDAVLSHLKDQTAEAEGLRIETGGKQCAILVFSNRVSLYIAPGTGLAVEKFKQTPPFESPLADSYEASRSVLELDMESGYIAVQSLTPRPTSLRAIRTPFGDFEPFGTSFVLKVTKDSASLAMFRGRAVFRGKNGKGDFIQEGQTGTVLKSDSEHLYPLKVSDIGLLDRKAEDGKISMCKNALECVEFLPGADGKITARKLLPKETFLK